MDLILREPSVMMEQIKGAVTRGDKVFVGFSGADELKDGPNNAIGS
jgi:hypothetical protein